MAPTEPQVPSPFLQAMVLAAGRGERMRPLTLVRAKPACPVGTWPLIWFALRFLRRQGYGSAAVNLHHLAGSVKRWLGPARAWDLELQAFEEETLLGTGGGPRALRDRFGEGPLLLLNGKLLLDGDLSAARERHQTSDAAATLFLWPNLDPRRYTSIAWGRSDGLVRDFLPAGAPSESESPADERWMFTGVQFLNPALLERLPAAAPSDLIRGLYLPLVRAGAVRAEIFPGSWFEVSDLKTYLQANQLLLAGKFGLPESPSITDGSCIDPQASVDPTARLSGCCVGTRSRVGARASLDRTLVWEDADIGADSRLSEVIVTDGVRLPAASSYRREILIADQAQGLRRFPLEPLSEPE
jgi:NDP-sugar pyrophosphorylase family protein